MKKSLAHDLAYQCSMYSHYNFLFITHIFDIILLRSVEKVSSCGSMCA